MIDGEHCCSPTFRRKTLCKKETETIASVVCLILVAAMIVTSFVGLGVM